MQDRDELLGDVRYRLEQAQAVAKRFYDKRHRSVEFKVGEWVWLRIRHRTPMSLPTATSGKLRPRYYGPYEIVEQINQVAFRLALPPAARIHDVFHVGLLKLFVGAPPATPPVLPPMHHGAVVPVPDQAVRACLARGVRQILVKWQGEPTSDATWEDVESFVKRYPHFQLVDELLVEGGEMLCGEDTIQGEAQGATMSRHRRDRRSREIKLLGLSRFPFGLVCWQVHIYLAFVSNRLSKKNYSHLIYPLLSLSPP